MKKWPRSLNFGLSLLILIVLFGVIGILMDIQNPNAVNLGQRFLAPSKEHILGTDHLGRSIFSRMVYGARVSLTTTFIALSSSVFIGVLLGLAAGFFGGVVDTFLVWLMDVVLAFPGFVLSLAIAGILGPSLENAVIAVILLQWVSYARLTRSLVFEVKEKEYIQVARFSGATSLQIIKKHIFPNIISPIIITIAMDSGRVMLRLASLSFLGLGAQEPISEWGGMIQEGRKYLQIAPWLVFFPGTAIFLTILSMNLIGEGLRDYLNPRRK